MLVKPMKELKLQNGIYFKITVKNKMSDKIIGIGIAMVLI
jgi:hypothetical protein